MFRPQDRTGPAAGRATKPRWPTACGTAIARSTTLARTPELAIRRGLHARGLRFRLYHKDLSGRPDLVFLVHRASRIRLWLFLAWV